MSVPRIVTEEYDTNGNLGKISWDGWRAGEDGTIDMLLALRGAMAKMKGSLVLTLGSESYLVNPTEAPNFRMIVDGARTRTLLYEGQAVKLSLQQSLLMGTLMAAQGTVFTAKALLAVLYPNPSTQPITGLTQVYNRMGELRKMFPDLIDRKKYVIPA